MENREILIANTRTQKRSKITTTATTLGELKTALAEAGIDYSGMTFTEGISKTQLLDDATQLPQNVMYKGNPTNNLVILLTNTKKNIASGGDRAAAYQAVKDNNLQEAVKEHFGRNFTLVPTEALWDFIGGKTSKPAMPSAEKEVEENPAKEERQETPAEEKKDDDAKAEEKKPDLLDMKDTAPSIKIASGVFFLLTHFMESGLVTIKEAKNLVKNILLYIEEHDGDVDEEEEEEVNTSVSTSDGSITDEDIDDMIDDLM